MISSGDMEMSKPRGFKKLGGDFVATKTQDNIATVVQPFLNSRILDGVLLKNISLSSGVNTVAHKLGRKIEGWIVVRQRADARIWDIQDSNVNVTSTLKLQTSAAVVVDLWIF
jgi:hypothetical protein